MKSQSVKNKPSSLTAEAQQKSLSEALSELQLLREENKQYALYIREKTNQLLQVMETSPLRPEEFNDKELLSLDPIGIIAGSFEQVFENLNETIDELSEARDELQAIFDATGVGISIVDQDFSIIKCNEKQRELLVDRQLGDVCGRRCYEVYCLKNGPGLDCPAVDTFATGRSVVVNEVRKKNKYFQLITTPFARDGHGMVTRVIEVALDITARKLAEKEEKRQRGYYLAEKSKLSSVLQSISEGLLVTDSRNRIISVNGAALQILDLSQKEFQERPVNELFGDATAGTSNIFQANTLKIHQNIEVTFKSEARDLLLSINAVPLYDADNNITGRIYTFRDITEAKHRQEVYHRTEKLAAVGQLSAGIAHELNTPLGSILGYARLLLKNDNLQPNQQERLAIIAEQATKSSTIIRQLLDFSRLSSTVPNRFTLCDCNRLVTDAVRVLQSEFSKRLVDLYQNLDSGLPQTAADPKRLEQVLVNILLNSAQAIDTKGTITIATKQVQEDVQITVADTGPGIEPENLSRIFDPFFTTKPVGTGTGLGLSICAGIMNDFGGTIDVQSTPGKGSVFTIILPLAE